MTLEQLVTLIAIKNNGSFKAAADELHKTQPSLSMAIKKLEEEFNLSLFDRKGYRPKLTEQGALFTKQSQKVLVEAKKLEKMAHEMGAGRESEIHICADAVFPIYQISPVIKTFFKSQSATQLNLSTDVLEGVIQKVMSHTVDFALGPCLNANDQIEAIKILETELIPVISKEHFNHNSVKLDYLKELPQIVVKSSAPEYRGEVHGGLSRQFWYTSDFSMKKQLIKSGLGWGRLPSYQITHELKHSELEEIKHIKEVKASTVPMYLIRSKTKVFGPHTKSLWGHLKEVHSC